MRRVAFAAWASEYEIVVLPLDGLGRAVPRSNAWAGAIVSSARSAACTERAGVAVRLVARTKKLRTCPAVAVVAGQLATIVSSPSIMARGPPFAGTATDRSALAPLVATAGAMGAIGETETASTRHAPCT